MKTRIRSVLLARLGYRSALKIDDVGVGSIHTVCQIPDDGVYMMPPGLRTCLPRAMLSPGVSDGS
ncbi:hypothetical protein [Dactylosporangium cerinum]